MQRNLLVVLLFFMAHVLSAQESIAVSGTNATGSGGSSSYTVGQVFYTINSGSGGTVTQGVQQSIELNTLSNLELTTVNLSAITYPNPASDHIILKISDTAFDNLRYNLIDVNGKAIANGTITNIDTQISLQSLALGMYILKVNQNNQELKTFKIIKK